MFQILNWDAKGAYVFPKLSNVMWWTNRRMDPSQSHRFVPIVSETGSPRIEFTVTNRFNVISQCHVRVPYFIFLITLCMLKSITILFSRFPIHVDRHIIEIIKAKYPNGLKWAIKNR